MLRKGSTNGALHALIYAPSLFGVGGGIKNRESPQPSRKGPIRLIQAFLRKTMWMEGRRRESFWCRRTSAE